MTHLHGLGALLFGALTLAALFLVAWSRPDTLALTTDIAALAAAYLAQICLFNATLTTGDSHENWVRAAWLFWLLSLIAAVFTFWALFWR